MTNSYNNTMQTLDSGLKVLMFDRFNVANPNYNPISVDSGSIYLQGCTGWRLGRCTTSYTVTSSAPVTVRLGVSALTAPSLARCCPSWSVLSAARYSWMVGSSRRHFYWMDWN